MSSKTNRLLLVSAYITVAVVWGSTYLAIRIGVQELPPFLFAGARHLTAGTILVLVSLIARQPFPRGWRAWGAQSLVGVLMLAGGNGLVGWAEQWVDSGVAALLVASVPLYAAALGAWLLGGRISVRGWLGLLVGLIGVAVLVGPGAPEGGRWIAGALMLLLASFFWALGSVLSQRRRSDGAFLPGLSVQMLAGGLVLGVAAVLTGQTSNVEITARGAGALAYLVFCGSILAYTAYLYLLRNMPAAKATTYAYINPAVAVILGAVVLGEEITGHLLLALPLILGGVLLVQVSRLARGGSARRSDKPPVETA